MLAMSPPEAEVREFIRPTPTTFHTQEGLSKSRFWLNYDIKIATVIELELF